MEMLHPYDAANGLGANRRPPLACQLILIGALSRPDVPSGEEVSVKNRTLPILVVM